MSVSEDANGEDRLPRQPRVPMPESKCRTKLLTEDEREWVAGVLYDPENEHAWLESSLVISRGVMR